MTCRGRDDVVYALPRPLLRGGGDKHNLSARTSLTPTALGPKAVSDACVGTPCVRSITGARDDVQRARQEHQSIHPDSSHVCSRRKHVG